MNSSFAKSHKLKNSAFFRSKEIIRLLGHDVENHAWRAVFGENYNGNAEFEIACHKLGCAYEFALIRDIYGNFELSCSFNSEPNDEIPDQAPKTHYHICDIRNDQSDTDRLKQMNLFQTEPAIYLEETLDKTYLIGVLRKSERLEHVMCNHLRVLL